MFKKQKKSDDLARGRGGGGNGDKLFALHDDLADEKQVGETWRNHK